MFSFTDSELHRLASEKMSFENWQAFEKALSAKTELLCYKPAKFANKEEYDKSIAPIMLYGAIGEDKDVLPAIMKTLSLAITALKNEGVLTIYDVIQTYPHLILN